MNHALWISILALAACGKGGGTHIDGVACDAKAVGDLAAKLDMASGINVDLTNEKVKADIAAAKKDVMGKTFAFTGCKFQSQGNDQVSFASSDGSKSIQCTMKNGEKGVTEFRHAAMAVGQDKLKLDVSGTIAEAGSAHFERVGMTGCEIVAHD
ncbi:MAG: hypothetical protein ABI678_31380 [Kofleriaceae bacterium]